MCQTAKLRSLTQDGKRSHSNTVQSHSGRRHISRAVSQTVPRQGRHRSRWADPGHVGAAIVLYELTSARVATFPRQVTGYAAEVTFSPDGNLRRNAEI